MGANPAAADRDRTKSTPSAFGNFALGENSLIPKDFKPGEQLQHSLAEVLKTGVKGGSIFKNAASHSMAIPSKSYLNNKRSSVFHKAFESQQLHDFKAPEYPKSPEQTAQLEELYTHSFLTKTLDSK